ncbi:hypothetical protein TWF506_003058 [Arthrobotrys conoides]|uniref:C2H2-type domain-containing protein n=1 Tax=Arthrobotrys conoides TaxID=74498 RepID=A0AAN8MYM3_9PEZI
MSAERKRQFIGQFLEYFEDFGVLICAVHRGAISHPTSQDTSVISTGAPADIEIPGPVEAFNYLEEPRKILICIFDGCGVSYPGETQIAKHINQTHDTKGTRWLPIRDKWKETISQTFFQKKNNTRYFEVYTRTRTENDIGRAIDTEETAFDRFLSDLKIRSKDIEGVVHSSEITPWMKRSGFWDHLIGFELETVHKATSLKFVELRSLVR